MPTAPVPAPRTRQHKSQAVQVSPGPGDGQPPDGGPPDGGSQKPGDGKGNDGGGAPNPADDGPRHHNIMQCGPVDDQDVNARYYAPLQDVFLRPALPSLQWPFVTTMTGVIWRYLPTKSIIDRAISYSIGKARPSFAGFFYQTVGNTFIGMGRTFTTFALATDRVLLKLMWSKLARSTHDMGTNAIHNAAVRCCPKVMAWAYKVAAWCSALKKISTPVICVGVTWGLYVIARHLIEPPPYEAPPGCYPSGGPLVEISQEEAPARAEVFVCPAPLARLVQERVMMCEREPVLIQKVKSIASKWCDTNGIQGNQRYQAIAGAVGAALTVPVTEQLVLQMAQSHAVQRQYARIGRYLAGIKHRSDPWWTKYFSYRH